MAEVLSQSQIDALLSEMRSGGNAQKKEDSGKEEKKYRKYDFYSPKKITKDKIKLLKGIYDNYSRIASSRLNGILRINCELTVLTVEEQRFYEFTNALNENDIFITQTLKLPTGVKKPPVLVHMSQPPMLSMIDRLLGGDGSDMEGVDSSYSYTDIELALYQKIMRYFLDFSLDAWSGYIHLETEDVALEENPSLFREISLDETIAIIILNIVTGSTEGKITVCFPRTLLSEMFAIIDSSKHRADINEVDEIDSRNTILSKITRTSLTVKASLGRSEVAVQDIRSLKPGDVIDLGKQNGSEIELLIGGKQWFSGTLGTFKKNSAVLVNGRMDRDPDDGGAEGKEEEKIVSVPAE